MDERVKYAEPLSSSCFADYRARSLPHAKWPGFRACPFRLPCTCSCFSGALTSFYYLERPAYTKRHYWQGCKAQLKAFKDYFCGRASQCLKSFLQQKGKLLKLILMHIPIAEILTICKSVLSVMLQQWQQALFWISAPLHALSASVVA